MFAEACGRASEVKTCNFPYNVYREDQADLWKSVGWGPQEAQVCTLSVNLGAERPNFALEVHTLAS